MVARIDPMDRRVLAGLEESFGGAVTESDECSGRITSTTSPVGF
ncbi:hypothetical protein [Paludibaculum fermentans]|nr:hypothetical protein [Paludibaculum fermentans]